jgi:predicted RNase H-like HicB family nuclease
MTQYLVIIERDEEGGYSAWAPDLPGVVAAASSYDEVLPRVHLGGWISSRTVAARFWPQ